MKKIGLALCVGFMLEGPAMAEAPAAIATPAIGDEVTVSAGGELYSSATVFEKGGARLGQDISWGEGDFQI